MLCTDFLCVCQSLIFFLNNPIETHIFSKENWFCKQFPTFLWCFVSSSLIFTLQFPRKENTVYKTLPAGVGKPGGCVPLLFSHLMSPDQHLPGLLCWLLWVTAKSELLEQRGESESCVQGEQAVALHPHGAPVLPAPGAEGTDPPPYLTGAQNLPPVVLCRQWSWRYVKMRAEGKTQPGGS